MPDGRVTIDLVIDAKTGDVRLLSREFERIGMQAGNTGRIIDTALGNIAARAAERLLVSLGRLGPAAYQAALAADDIGAAYRDTFEGASAELDAFVKTWANSVGETDAFGQEIISNIAMIGQGFGMNTEASEDFSRRLLLLARDLTSRYGKPIQQSMESLRGAIVGNSESLREQFGISVMAEDIKERAIRTTGRSAEALTQEDKALAALELAYERAGRAVGDYAKTSDSAANRARAGLGTLRQHALDLARGFMPIFEDLTQIAGGFLYENQEAIAAAIQRVADYGEAVYQFGKEYAATIGQIAKFLWQHKELVATLAIGWGIYKVAVNSARIAQALFNLVARANPIGLLVTALVVAIGLWVTFKDRIYDAGAAMAEWGADAIRTIGEVSTRMAGITAGLGATNPIFAGASRAWTTMAAGAEGAAQRLDGLAASARDSAAASRETAEALAGGGGGGTPDVETAMDVVSEGAVVTAKKVDDVTTAMEAAQKAAEDLATKLGDLRRNQAALTLLEKERILLEDQVGLMEDKIELDALRLIPVETLARLHEESEEIARQVRFLRERARLYAGGAEMEATPRPPSEEGPFVRGNQFISGDELDALFERMQRFQQGVSDMQAEVRAKLEDMGASALDFSSVFQDAFTDATVGMAQAIAAGDMEGVAAALLGTLGDLATRLGKLLIGFGFAGLALKKIVIQPGLAIAAGAALVALGAIASRAASRLVDSTASGSAGSGGEGASSGRTFSGSGTGGGYTPGSYAGRYAGDRSAAQLSQPVVNVTTPEARFEVVPLASYDEIRVGIRRAEDGFDRTRGSKGRG